MAYNVERIAKVALELLNHVGLDGLTTRRLADKLGVQGPALYHHFKSKAELLGVLATEILRESLGMIVDHGDWKRWLLDHAVTNRLTLLRYRDSARIVAASAPTYAMRRKIMPTVAKPLLDAGFKRNDAFEAISLVAAFTLGYVIEEQNDVMRRYISSVIDVDRGFLHCVEALIAGIEVKYAARAKPRRVALRVVAGRERR
jgi:TetR/AcrR family transcriptional regulator, tetracycline repressor protein